MGIESEIEGKFFDPDWRDNVDAASWSAAGADEPRYAQDEVRRLEGVTQSQAGRIAYVEGERDRALAALARVKALADEWDDEDATNAPTGDRTNELRAALAEPTP